VLGARYCVKPGLIPGQVVVGFVVDIGWHWDRFSFYHSRTSHIRTLLIRIVSTLPSNLPRILQNYLALTLPDIGSSAVQCYGFCNFKSGVVERFRRRYIL
jgi:hypothetical protein